MKYPHSSADRRRFVLGRRSRKAQLDSHRAYGVFAEIEPFGLDGFVSVATVLLTNRECPWKCTFCDLWKYTLDETVPSEDLRDQVRSALVNLPAARWIKLYNAGSFFDPRAIPPGVVPAVAELLAPFERVIVESHPALIDEGAGSRVLEFRDQLRACSIRTSRSSGAHSFSGAGPGCRSVVSEGLSPSDGSTRIHHVPRRTDSFHDAGASPSTSLISARLEVAMGLETVHPIALERLNKGMTLDDFARAADVLRESDIDLRAFVLVQPPFAPPEEAVKWAIRSLEFARDQGARMVAFIPTRGGNGAMEALAATGDFVPPRVSTLEEVLDRALESAASRRGPLVLADLWDLERFSHCPTCFPARKARLHRMNLSQQLEPRISCDCGS